MSFLSLSLSAVLIFYDGVGLPSSPKRRTKGKKEHTHKYIKKCDECILWCHFSCSDFHFVSFSVSTLTASQERRRKKLYSKERNAFITSSSPCKNDGQASRCVRYTTHVWHIWAWKNKNATREHIVHLPTAQASCPEYKWQNPRTIFSLYKLPADVSSRRMVCICL